MNCELRQGDASDQLLCTLTQRARLEAVDEGNEEHALEAVLVQRIRPAVAGGHKHQAAVPEPPE